MNIRNVILVTDGDEIARSAVELASHNIGAGVYLLQEVIKRSGFKQ